jgi:hypothetical protein
MPREIACQSRQSSRKLKTKSVATKARRDAVKFVERKPLAGTDVETAFA